VRIAMVTASSVGSAYVSSSELGVQRLGAAQHCRQRLEGGADHVVVRLLRRERHAGRLRVRAQRQADGLLRPELLPHHPRVDAPRRAELRDLLEEVVVHVPEEAEPRREVVHVHPRLTHSST